MKLPPGIALRIELAQSGSDVRPVGRLALDRRGAVLEYDPAFIAAGRRINPLDAAVAGPVPAREPRIFGGLHGVLADSLPDAWGTELTRRRCARAGIAYESLTALDRLAIVGKRGMGALTYQPDFPDEADDRMDFDALAGEAEAVLAGRDSDLLPELERLGGSAGGARPKVLVAIDGDGHAISGTGDIPPGYEGWLVKFRSSRDAPDTGALEVAYAAMARVAGIDVPDHRLIPAQTGSPGYFASKRFDRLPGGGRRQVVSAAGVLDIDWTVPQIDYHALLQVVRRVTRSQAEVEEMFRRMLFNVAAHNRDDHAKQHAFLCGPDGAWHLTPAYDLTYSSGPGGEHYLAVSGEAADIGPEAITLLAKAHAINSRRLRTIAGDVLDAVGKFTSIAGATGVSGATAAEVARALASAQMRLAELAR